MGRYARIKTDIWDDADFLALRIADQHLYFALASNTGLSRCGVVDYIPSRFEHLAADMTSAKFKASVGRLREAKFFVIDERTQELLVRTYVRHDGVFDRVNMGKAVGTAFEAIVSAAIRKAVGSELARLMQDSPDLPGWPGLAITSPTAHALACGMTRGKQ